MNLASKLTRIYSAKFVILNSYRLIFKRMMMVELLMDYGVLYTNLFLQLIASDMLDIIYI